MVHFTNEEFARIVRDENAEWKKQENTQRLQTEMKNLVKQKVDVECLAQTVPKLKRAIQSETIIKWTEQQNFVWKSALQKLGACPDETKCLCQYLMEKNPAFEEAMKKNGEKRREWRKNNPNAGFVDWEAFLAGLMPL